MKYLKQFFIIAGFSMAGELLNAMLPFSIPASVYGLVLLFFCLLLGIVKLEAVETAGDWLIAIMPVCFINPGVSIITILDEVIANLLPVFGIAVISTLLVFAVTGQVAQLFMKHAEKKEEK